MWAPTRDLQRCARDLRRTPVYTLVIVCTLALGIGGSAAIFSFVSGVLLQPLPYPEPEKLVHVCETQPDRSDGWCGASPGNLLDWQKSSRTLESIALGRTWSFGLRNDDGRFENLRGGVATAGLFEILGAHPFLGEVIQPEHHVPGADQVAVLSHGLWQRRFGGDRSMVGRNINLDGDLYQVIGVLPDRFDVPLLEDIDLWIPLWANRVDWRHWRGLRPYGRLAEGHSLEEAQIEMRSIATSLSERYPETNADWSVEVVGIQDRMVASVRPALLVLLGAVSFVVLVACANSANLMLARATSRRKVIAIQAALGAGKLRISRQFLTESLLLAAIGGLAGVLLAVWLVNIFVAMAPDGFPRLEEVGVDGRVILFAFLLSAATSVLFGVFPAWHSARIDLNEALREGRQGGSTGTSNRARGILVVAEVSLALVLLTGAGLLVRSFAHLVDWKPGFNTNNLVTFSLFPPLGKYQDASALGSLYDRINRELSSLPGVVSVGNASAGPLFGGGDGVQEFHIEGRAVPAEGNFPTVAWYDSGPGYFETIGIPLLEGRTFDRSDTRESPLVAVINETMARRYWPDGSPLGERVRLNMQEITVEIVGVVADVSPFDPRIAVEPQLHWPLAQHMRGATFVAVRTATDPTMILASLRDRLTAIEPEMALGSMATLDQRISKELIRPRFATFLLGLFSGIALLIATIGIYGVISYSVAQRIHEFGVRMALGALPRDLVRMVLKKGLLLAGLGIAAGALGSVAVTGLLQSMLVEVSPNDTPTLLTVSAILLCMAGLASWAPARRSARVDPMMALRNE